MFDILSEIDDSRIKSEVAVLKSMCEVYDKAYTILENCSDDDISLSDFDIIQEAVGEETKEMSKSKKKDNIVVKVFDAICGFFKSIGQAISNFFKKAKLTITERLNRLFKKSDKSCNETQALLDDSNSPEGKKYNSAEGGVNEALDKKFDEKLAEDNSSKDSEDDSKNTTIGVKDKTVRTRIRFSEWVRFLEYTDTYITRLTKVDNLDSNMIKGAVSTRPTRSINPLNKGKLKIDIVQGIGDDIIDGLIAGSDVRKSRIKNVKLYTKIPKKQPMNEVADYIEKVGKLLNNVTDNVKKASESFYKTAEFLRRLNEARSGIYSGKFMKKLSLIQTELSNITVISLHMMGYMAQELNAYSVLLDIIEPIVDEFEKEQERKHKK